MKFKAAIVRVTWGQAIVLSLIAVVILFTPLLKNPYHLDTLVTIFLWVGLAGAWNIVGGYAGQLSLGHGAFFGIGAYTSTVLFLKWSISPFIGLPAGGVVAVIIAVGIGLVCFRLKGPFFVLATLAFGEVAHILTVDWRSLTGGTTGLQIPFDAGWSNLVFNDEMPYVYIALLYLIVVFALNKYMENSRVGYQLIAIREDEDAARSLGINTWRAKLFALAISALLTAIGGSLYAQYIKFIDPDSTMGWAVSIQPALLTIVGGSGTAAGPVLGGLIMVPLSQVIRAELGGTYSGAHLAIYGAILIVVVLFLPKGLIDVLRKRRPRFWNKPMFLS